MDIAADVMDGLKGRVRSALDNAAAEKLRIAKADIRRLEDELKAAKVCEAEEKTEKETMEVRLQSALIDLAKAETKAESDRAALVEAGKTIAFERTMIAALEKRIDSLLKPADNPLNGWSIDVQKDGSDVTRRLILKPMEGK